MPVAKTGPPPARQALLIGLGVICGLGAVIFLVTQLDQLTAENEATVDLGAPIFSLGSADDLAAEVAETGRPFFLPDATGGERGLWVYHIGDDPAEGWVAVAMRAPGMDDDCLLEWDTDLEVYVDICDGMEYPADGTGLRHYPISVDPDGDLNVNLNRSE